MESKTIFYSWQSDDPKTNEYIQKALETVIVKLTNDPTIEVSPRLDSDTKHIPGSPEIPTTILSKIDSCDVFVADISFIGEHNRRMLVNQNVLFELGYNMGKHSYANTLLLFNKDSGQINELPFDLRSKRVIGFSIKNDPYGNKLIKKIIEQLRIQFQNNTTTPATTTMQQSNPSLDEDEMAMMKYFAKMSGEKRVMVSRTMGGIYLTPIGPIEEALAHQLEERMTEEEMVANLESLQQKGFLKVDYGSKGTPNYAPTKTGFALIKTLQ